MTPQLTSGAIEKFMNGESVQNAIVQILSYKKIQSATTSDRFRLLISDGVTISTCAILGTQLNHMILNNELEKFTVIQIDKYITNNHSDKTIVIFLEVTVLVPGSEVGKKLGNPDIAISGDNIQVKKEPFSGDNIQVKKEPFSGDNIQVKKEPLSVNKSVKNIDSSNTNHMNKGFNNDVKPSIVRDSAMNIGLHPISALTPYQNKWTIKARVTGKQPIRYWNNSRGEGKLFSVNLLDESGEIRATGFNDAVDKFHDILEINKVYYISKATLKTANRNFSSIKNDYEMTFNADTTISPCEDHASSIPMLQFNFIPIQQIEQVDKDTLIDVIGICKSASETQKLTSRVTNKELVKRDIKLVDASNTDIKLTLWGVDAEKFDASQNPVVAVKGARVSDFGGGKSVSMISSSVMQINPDIKEVRALKGWFHKKGCKLESTSLSAISGQNAEGVWKNFAQVSSENLGVGDKPSYYTNKVTIVLIRKENCMYMACPGENCNKKVIDMNNGNYRCEKCNKEYPNFKWRLLLSMNIADFTGSQWVVCFHESAELILGFTAQELGQIKESNEEKFNDIIAEANFKSFIFNLRTKMEVFNEESRLKTQVLSVQPINFVSYGKQLVKAIKSM